MASGNASTYGDMPGQRLAVLIVAIAATREYSGYWLVGADGGVFTFGDAGIFGAPPDEMWSYPANGCP